MSIEPIERPSGLGSQAYAAFRVVLGGYLLIHFLQLLPWAAELFSNQGMLPEGSASPLLHPPNLLAISDAPWLAVGLVAAGAALSVAFLLGKRDRLAAVGIWFVWACLFGRNPLIANPSMPFIGLLLLAHALTPPPEEGQEQRWRLPRGISAAIWIVMALAYSYSGITKLVSPSWVDGSAVRHILDNPLARPTAIRDLLLSLPSGLLRGMTWGVLGLEILFAPLCLIRRARPWIWSLLLGMHLGLLVLIDFADLTFGMIVLHLYTFDPAWLPGGLRDRVREGWGALTGGGARRALFG